MPEGHTIHRIADRHRSYFAGKVVHASSPQGRFAAGASHLDGRTLLDVQAYGKHLVYTWDAKAHLHVHLGLVGKFRTHPAPAPAPSPATRLVLESDAAAAYLTGPMKCELVDRTTIHDIVDRLGPDPLRNGVRREEFVERLVGIDQPVGAVLLDQGVIAGVGNVYRSEILFLCGVHPHRSSADLSADDVAHVWTAARSELRRGLEDGRIITVRPRDVGAARRSDLPESLRRYVYKREHRPCLRCKTPIESTELAGRRIWWCPRCQPA